MTITADGRLLVCAQDYNNDLFIGNILDKDSTVEVFGIDQSILNLERMVRKDIPT